MSFIIRPLQETDDIVVAQIIRSCFEEFNAPRTGSVYDDPVTDQLYETFSATAGSAYWVVEVEGRVQGGAGIFPSNGLPAGVCELVKIYLQPEARGRGWARLLMEKCIATAREMGYQNIYIESFPHFKTAVGLYEKMGFMYIAEPMGATGHTSCTVWMLRTV
jgi:putative acetyltransferase